ncbi:hypothetical protein ACFCYB_37005 [Streptomyces sp. NPDC056309]|uniref:hypothetical protein n=1 Tax=Streptomyces sp. NPDC056309 TaxID=3345781 RepID=UPI0035E00B06
MEGVNWSIGGKTDRIKLRGFTCCPGCRAEIVRHPQDRRPCTTPWAHEVQSYFREHAIADTNGKSRSCDQRLLLLHDVEDLVGAAVHSSTRHSRGTSAVFERRLEAYATASSRHGQRLSNSEYASQALLKAVITDIGTRHDPNDEVFLTAFVLPENTASQRCLERHAWVQRKSPCNELLLYAVRLDVAQRAHVITRPNVSTEVLEEPAREPDKL